MRVLHLLKTSAGARWAWLQMRELVHLGVEVHVAVPADGDLFGLYREAGVVVHEVQTAVDPRRPWRLPELLRTVRNLVEEVGPDLVHSHFVTTTLAVRWALGKRHRTPRIFQVPGPLHLEHALPRKLELVSAGPADQWIGGCCYTFEQYRKLGIPDERLFLSYPGMDVEAFAAAERGTLRALPGVRPDARLIGMVAFMYPPRPWLGLWRGIKGHEDLVDAIAIVAKQRPDIQCVFVGGAWRGAAAYEKRVRAYGAKLLGDRAVFLGTRTDVAALYADMDLAVHPSHSENLGGAVESLLLGVPTITTNVGGFPDLVSPGKTGWLVPPRNPKALAAVILEALENPDRAREMAAEGSRMAREMFDIRRTAREILGIYEKVTSRSELSESSPQ